MNQLIKSFKKGAEKPLFSFFVLPLIISFLVYLLTTLIIIDKITVENYFNNLGSKTSFICAFISWVITSYMTNYKVYGKYYSTLNFMSKILNEFPAPLHDYIVRKIGENGERIDSEIHQLRRKGIESSLSKKLEIINSLIIDLSKDIDFYWATNLDRPSELIASHPRFWEIQERHLKNVKEKRRLVILNEGHFIDEVSSHNSELIEFINWHNRNKFELRFLLNDNKKYEGLLEDYLSSDDETDISPLIDFALIGKNWVYGEDKKIIRLHGGDFSELHRVPDYFNLFRELWNSWDTRNWSFMSAEQVVLICQNDSDQKLYAKDKIKYYESIGISNHTGTLCFDNLLKKIENASKTIEAIDIVTLKTDILEWQTKESYKKWMNATISGAKNTALVSRVFILNDQLKNEVQRNLFYNYVLRPHIEGGVNVYLVSAFKLLEKNIPVYDFILVDDELCFSLQWKEEFLEDKISIETNLNHPNEFFKFDYYFKKIVKQKFTMKLNGKSEIEILENLESIIIK